MRRHFVHGIHHLQQLYNKNHRDHKLATTLLEAIVMSILYTLIIIVTISSIALSPNLNKYEASTNLKCPMQASKGATFELFFTLFIYIFHFISKIFTSFPQTFEAN